MDKISNPIALTAKLLLFMVIVLLGISPGLAGAEAGRNFVMPESSPGGLKVTWYSAKRSNTGVGLRSLIAHADAQFDKNKSEASYKSFDRSICWGTESLSDLSFDTARWVKADDQRASDAFDNWVWGEITGYIKMPEDGQLCFSFPHDTAANFTLEVEGVMISNNWYKKPPFTPAFTSDVGSLSTNTPFFARHKHVISYNFKKDDFVSIRLRIGCPFTDTGRPNTMFSLKFGVLIDLRNAYPIPQKNFYPVLALKDMKKYFMLDPSNFTLTLDSLHSGFPAGGYEYGICDENEAATAAGFKPLKFGINQLDRNSGSVIIRRVDFFHREHEHITVGSLSVPGARNLAVTFRTPTTATLSWNAPEGPDTPAGYDIYRKIVGRTNDFSFLELRTIGTEPQMTRAGSTGNLTFTDKGLDVGNIYEYYVKAQYKSGFSYGSNTVRTDMVAVTGIPPTPTGLKAGKRTGAGAKADLTLQWSSPITAEKIKEYVIYRRVAQSLKYGISEVLPYEIGRSSMTAYVDKGLFLGDKYEYYVQAIDEDGSPSLISPPLELTIEFTITPDLLNIIEGTTGNFTLNFYDGYTGDRSGTWSIADDTVASVDKNGKVTGKKAGTTTAAFTSTATGVREDRTIVVRKLFTMTPSSSEINNGDTVNFVVTFDEGYTGSREGTWSVADGTIASVEENSAAPIVINPKHTIPGRIGAKVTGKKAGTTKVTFTNTATGVRQDCTVIVKPLFTISPNPLTLYPDGTGSLAVVFDDGYTGSRNGRWSVDDNTIVSIDKNGIVTGKKTGTAAVTLTVPFIPDGPTARNGAAAGKNSIMAATREQLPAFNMVRTVTVVVKPATFTVSFDPNGGSPAPPGVTVKHNTTVARPDDPLRNNFTFLGWYTALSGGSKWDFANDKVTAEMTLYAYWAAEATPSSTSSDPGPAYTMPAITGPDTMNLLEGYDNIDQAYAFDGYPGPTYGISSTLPNTANATFAGTTLTLPEGLTTAGSPYYVTLTATNSVGTATKTITVNVYPQIQPSFASQIDFILSRPDNSISASGGSGGPYTFALAPGSSMPSGLTLHSDGTITGTAATGVYLPGVSVIIRDSVGNSITTTPAAVVVVD